MRARAGSQVRHEQREADEDEERRAASFSRHVYERRIHVGKAGPVSPDQLRQIDQDRREYTRDQAREHCRQQDVPSRVLDFFRERRDTIEPDIVRHAIDAPVSTAGSAKVCGS